MLLCRGTRRAEASACARARPKADAPANGWSAFGHLEQRGLVDLAFCERPRENDCDQGRRQKSRPPPPRAPDPHSATILRNRGLALIRRRRGRSGSNLGGRSDGVLGARLPGRRYVIALEAAAESPKTPRKGGQEGQREKPGARGHHAHRDLVKHAACPRPVPRFLRCARAEMGDSCAAPMAWVSGFTDSGVRAAFVQE